MKENTLTFLTSSSPGVLFVLLIDQSALKPEGRGLAEEVHRHLSLRHKPGDERVGRGSRAVQREQEWLCILA